MQPYVRDRFRSRRLDPDFDQFTSCEFPKCKNVVQDIHHIEQSMRGRRTHKKDGSDLIGLCRECHERVHAHNSSTTREKLKNRVSHILEYVNGK